MEFRTWDIVSQMSNDLNDNKWKSAAATRFLLAQETHQVTKSQFYYN